MARAFLVVMDSVGCGGAPDADQFFNGTIADTGSNTLAHIAQACAEGRANTGRSGPLHVPNLNALGLGAAVRLASGDDWPAGYPVPTGGWGAATEQSPGKDTPSGHWELAGLPVPWNWNYFTNTTNSFPPDVIGHVCDLAQTDGILGNCHASGTAIIAAEGAAHQKTGWPICYTSADSVFQIAAHEQSFGLERLLTLCKELAPRLHDMKVGRVIARPFVGDPETGFTRTANRKDFAIAPPADTLCDRVQALGGQVHAIGKIGDIFSMRGIDTLQKGTDAELMEHFLDSIDTVEDHSLTFANFVEFDSLYGHRRDIAGYAAALEWFDAQLPRMIAKLRPDDIIVFTADHGNDPSWPGTDHTRERVPVLVAGGKPGPLGLMPFTGVAELIEQHLKRAT